MRITLAAIGKLKAGPERALIDDYAKRITASGRQAGVTDFRMVEGEAPRGLSGPARQDKEGDLLLTLTAETTYRIALDESGKAMTSADFAGLIKRLADRGEAGLGFVIGGADGHGAPVRSACQEMLSLGKMTWPHMLARVLLVEQLYRAMTILTGHPYHRS